MLLIAWLVSAAFSFLLVLPRMAKPIIGWEICSWDVARSISEGGPASVRFFYLPPLYTSLIALSFKLFGISEASARIPGALCFIAVLLVICLLIKEISSNKEESLPAGIIALILFVFSPAVPQGFLMIDTPDTTLFMLLACLFYLFLFKTEALSLGWRVIWLGILYALCLWAKMTTALSFLIALPLSFLLTGERKTAVNLSLGVFFFGAVLFILSWFSYCYFIPGAGRFMEPFNYYAMNTADSFFVGLSEKIARIILDMFRISLWFSPFLLILGVPAVFDMMKNSQRQENKKIIHLAVFSLIVIAGYLAANATFSSFPKYLVPALPTLYCVIACYIWRIFRGALNRGSAVVFFLSASAGVFYYLFFTGDIIYDIFLLRQAQLHGDIFAYVCRMLAKGALYLSFPAFVALISARFMPVSLGRRIIFGMFTALIAANIAVTLAQIKADYSLNYGYGSAGIEELKEFLEEKAPLEVFTTTEGVIVNMPGVKFSGPTVGAWETPAAFLEFMFKIKPRAFLYGLPVNNIKQLKTVLLSPEVKGFMNRNYDKYEFGDYELLIRREALGYE